MTALVCIDTKAGKLRRYDTERDEGLTHVGFFDGGALGIEDCVEAFRLNPPDSLRSEIYLHRLHEEKVANDRILELVRELHSLGVTDMHAHRAPAFKLLADDSGPRLA